MMSGQANLREQNVNVIAAWALALPVSHRPPCSMLPAGIYVLFTNVSGSDANVLLSSRWTGMTQSRQSGMTGGRRC